MEEKPKHKTGIEPEPPGQEMKNRPRVILKYTIKTEVKAIKKTQEEAKIASRDWERQKAVVKTMFCIEQRGIRETCIDYVLNLFIQLFI